jgi:hypothetical protein
MYVERSRQSQHYRLDLRRFRHFLNKAAAEEVDKRKTRT